MIISSCSYSLKVRLCFVPDQNAHLKEFQKVKLRLKNNIPNQQQRPSWSSFEWMRLGAHGLWSSEGNWKLFLPAIGGKFSLSRRKSFFFFSVFRVANRARPSLIHVQNWRTKLVRIFGINWQQHRWPFQMSNVKRIVI